MSREQIEEMAKDLQKSEHWYFNDHSVDFELDRKKTAENLYNAGYRKQELISVDEKLPEPKTDVLVLFVDGSITMDFRMPGYGFMYGNEVTHWMPLPESPKMKGGGE